MTFDPTKNQRRSIRLAGFDYSHVGAYFVTIYSLNQVPLFGSVMDGEMRTNELGDVIRNCWHEIPFHFPGVTLDAFVVMPNHVHGILIVGARHASPAPPLGTIVGSFKSTVRRRARRPVWQRNYYERVVRDERELNLIRHYIENNPLTWATDLENPTATIRTTPGVDPRERRGVPRARRASPLHAELEADEKAG